MVQVSNPAYSELGKQSRYDAVYNPDKLFPIAREQKRIEIGLDPTQLPFYGFDCWNHYEVSWLDEWGKPVVALAEIIYDCNTPNIVESKSLKLYFNSLNNTPFKDTQAVIALVKKDLEPRIGAKVMVNITPLSEISDSKVVRGFAGICIDDLPVPCSVYTVDPSFLFTNGEEVEEALYSDLLRSNCLITNQPDWGTVQIVYQGKKINHEGLLKYIVSFRNHNEFHEQCIERMFVDVMRQCKPKELMVYGRYTRRGGLDINPYRSTQPTEILGKNFRLCRQ
jgi:7-cyano-7-deazaguanine reductase